MKLGTVKRSVNAEGYEVRERLEGIAQCPTCGKDVELWSDTEEWVQTKAGKWIHSQYGPAQGVCCHNLIVDSFDGCFVYDLTPEVQKA